ncbi:MAG: long-chain fatty acid--CoA ligase, partial [Thermoleophilia bacterium]|nr:long-chain fatty acid--CoA ligase [Thermoleophilia bacterium]
MSDRHYAHWPAHLPSHHLTLPETHLYRNVEVSALRYPDKPFMIFYGAEISFARFQAETERLAGYLQQQCG